MLFIAGLIEGIFRQTVTNIHDPLRGRGRDRAWWICYFGFGRGTRSADAPQRQAADEVTR